MTIFWLLFACLAAAYIGKTIDNAIHGKQPARPRGYKIGRMTLPPFDGIR